MVAMEPRWDKILEQIMLVDSGMKSQERAQEERRQVIHHRLSSHERIQKATNNMLYGKLLACTEGDALATVKAHGTDGAVEAFKHVVSKGKNA